MSEASAPYCAGRMFDSAHAVGVPQLGPGDIAAGYFNGHFESYGALLRRFGASVLSIDVTGKAPKCTALDVERGDATVGDIVRWVRDHDARTGRQAVVYVNRSSWAEAQGALGGTAPLWWVADWTGAPHLPPGADACQFESNGVFDTSVFSPRFVEQLGLGVATALDPLFLATGDTPQDQGAPVFGSLAADRQDDFYATLRVLWNQYRTDALTESDQALYYLAYMLPITSPGSFAGHMDLVVAHLVDDARSKGVLRSFYAEGAV